MDAKKEVEQAIKIQDEVQKAIDRSFVENLIKDNKIQFDYKGTQYRVRLPSYKERLELNKKRTEKYLELLRTKDSEGNYLYKLEIDLRKIYRERGEDIDELDKTFQSLENQKNIYKEKLGKALVENKSDSDLETFKVEVERINKEQQEVSMKKSILLEFSLENNLLSYVYTYLAYLVTEKLEGEEWSKLWNTFEDFENGTPGLVNLSAFYVTLLTNAELT